ncbi:hypothetical protein CASFOL_004181 [Castilleja foliolosa]|uniref:ARM repeat superfamily protein n=1 Tax=Castilleja foliolosa TaxID=1961234 RepID=A0ABD3EJP8_9LAMI
MLSTIPAHLKFKPPSFCTVPADNHCPAKVFSVKRKFNKNPSFHYHYLLLGVRNPSSKISVSTRACSDGGQAEIFSAKKTQSSASDVETLSNRSSSSSNDSYVSLFIRMLGLDNDPQDREHAVVALWKYSLGGKHCIDNIMKYDGTINLIVSLLKSDSDSAREAAAGLLRELSSINLYREFVAQSGAVEELTGLLTRPSLSSDVKVQTICTLWNLSVEKKLSAKMTNSEILPLLIKNLEDEDNKVKEASGGVLASLALSQSNHKIMVEAGVIPKLAKLLTDDVEESKLIRKVARNALLELTKDEYNRILIMDEGLVLVPLIGASAYKSFRPSLYSWPSLPDGTKIDQSPKGPSRYGASELLLGLHIDNENADIEEAKANALIGRTQQQFLARVGAIEIEDDGKSDGEESSSQRLTLLPWVDGVARLVLILGLEDESAVARAAGSIADASINEHMRFSFKVAGAVKSLVELISHPSETVRLAVVRALDRLSISKNVCQTIEAEGVLQPLVNLLKKTKPEVTCSSTSMILNILTRILDPIKEIKSKFNNGPVGDTDFVGCLVDILKSPNPDLQRKSASVLEFIAVIEDEPSIETLISAGIESGLKVVFQQKSLLEMESDTEIDILELEEAGQAVTAASRLLTKLLDYEMFRLTVNSQNLTKLLRPILVSTIPLQYKDWVAACLVKLSQNLDFDNPVNMEVTLYETIPRLIEQIEGPFSDAKARENAVLELNRIISEGMVDATRAVASQGGIFALVKMLTESGVDERAVEASLALLYNMSMDSENHAAIIAAGAVPVLRKLVLTEGPHWTRALRLLRTLPI